MSVTDIVVVVLVCVAVLAAVGVIIYRKVKHKGGCCDCCDCCGCTQCKGKKPENAEIKK